MLFMNEYFDDIENWKRLFWVYRRIIGRKMHNYLTIV